MRRPFSFVPGIVSPDGAVVVAAHLLWEDNLVSDAFFGRQTRMPAPAVTPCSEAPEGGVHDKLYRADQLDGAGRQKCARVAEAARCRQEAAGRHGRLVQGVLPHHGRMRYGGDRRSA
ncbi:hypothetical protein BQ8482_180259 [Mesorhizobium delmotii]|uniref:Uncharacterized protein n=1 Tax=Mesorhizobium delmotii TaxID=1631247 RepID=A0A2P9AIT4_9HYPH|nr:hypothetical protein BQ8482_180259 [Mesorhizobium delmotii]